MNGEPLDLNAKIKSMEFEAAVQWLREHLRMSEQEARQLVAFEKGLDGNDVKRGGESRENNDFTSEE